jgi:histidyl-tRNA synthetase
MIGARLWRDLGIEGQVRLEINSLGDAAARAAHRGELVAYLEAHRELLDSDAQRRLHSNPLRILDSKNPAMAELIAGAPRLLDRLDAESAAHFDGLRRSLDAAGIGWTVNPRLVRGLDYYNRTVFEWVTDALGAQGTICAGGRYDGLVGQLGGRPAPACGFALGIERVMALAEQSSLLGSASVPAAYLVHQGDAAGLLAARVAETLRGEGLAVVVHCGGGKFAAQMRRADASGARYAIIIGEDEAARGLVSLKPLRESGEQRQLPPEALVQALGAPCAPAA